MDHDSPDDRINPAPSGDAPAPRPPSRRGGRRPGAGRPKGVPETFPRVTQKRAASFRERYETAVEKNARQLIDAAIRAGTRGDSRMLLDMVTRFVGPARTAVEISGPNGLPLQLQAMTATALAALSTDQLLALASVHQTLGIAPSGDPALALPLSPSLGTPSLLPQPIVAHEPSQTHPDASQVEPQTDQPTAQLTAQPIDQDTSETEGNGGSSSSQSNGEVLGSQGLGAAAGPGTLEDA